MITHLAVSNKRFDSKKYLRINIVMCTGVRVTKIMVLERMIGFIDPSLYNYT
jgi:hypothetical protein